MEIQINYIVISEEMGLKLYFPYEYYNDITRYYNVENQLHRHQAVKDHYTLLIF